jgi:predicted MFS family arabinose efflux permease
MGMSATGGEPIEIPTVFLDRNYRRYLGGNFASTIGIWTQRTAIGWLTWELTKSATWLGLISVAETGPTILCGLYAGAVLDRLSHLGVLRFTQALTLLYSVVLFALTYLGLINIWLLAGLVLFKGTVFAFNRPARATVVYGLVGRDQMMSALSGNAVVFQSSKVIGPSVAGVTIALIGTAGTFAIAALLILTFTIVLSFVRVMPVSQRPREPASVVSEVAEGLRYIVRHPTVSFQLFLLITVALCAKPLPDLLPGFAGAVFGRDASGLAWLLASHGIGAFAAGLWLTFGVGDRRLVALACFSIVGMGVAIILFALFPWFVLACMLLVVIGFFFVVMDISSQTLIQTSIRSRYRGRTMSIYGMVSQGVPSLGTLTMGAIAETAGLRLPVFVGACVALVIGATAWVSRGKLKAQPQ